MRKAGVNVLSLHFRFTRSSSFYGGSSRRNFWHAKAALAPRKKEKNAAIGSCIIFKKRRGADIKVKVGGFLFCVDGGLFERVFNLWISGARFMTYCPGRRCFGNAAGTKRNFTRGGRQFRGEFKLNAGNNGRASDSQDDGNKSSSAVKAPPRSAKTPPREITINTNAQSRRRHSLGSTPNTSALRNVQSPTKTLRWALMTWQEKGLVKTLAQLRNNVDKARVSQI